LARHRSENNFVGVYQINYVGRSSNVAKSFDNLAISLSVLHNYFDRLTKLFSDLYLAKFLDTSSKPSFPPIVMISLVSLHISKLIKLHN